MNSLSKKTKSVGCISLGMALMGLSQYAFSGMALSSETTGVFSIWSFLVASAALYTVMCVFLIYGVGFRHSEHMVLSKKRLRLGLMFLFMLCLSRFVMDDIFADGCQLPSVHDALVSNDWVVDPFYPSIASKGVRI